MRDKKPVCVNFLGSSFSRKMTKGREVGNCLPAVDTKQIKWLTEDWVYTVTGDLRFPYFRLFLLNGFQALLPIVTVIASSHIRYLLIRLFLVLDTISPLDIDQAQINGFVLHGYDRLTTKKHDVLFYIIPNFRIMANNNFKRFLVYRF